MSHWWPPLRVGAGRDDEWFKAAAWFDRFGKTLVGLLARLCRLKSVLFHSMNLLELSPLSTH